MVRKKTAPSLSVAMNAHQVEWRRSNVSSAELGTWRRKPYPWIVPRNLWEEGLWPGIRTGSDNPLPAYLEAAGVQKHSGVHNLKISWILCANLYFPFRCSRRDRNLLASFLRWHVTPQIETVDAIELEYSEDGELHPSRLLGEMGGSRGAMQTSPDLVDRLKDLTRLRQLDLFGDDNALIFLDRTPKLVFYSDCGYAEAQI